MSRTVDRGGFGKRIRDLAEGGAHDNDVIRDTASRNNQTPVGVHHVEIADNNVGRDQTAVKNHREGDKEIERLFPVQSLDAHDIRGQDRQKGADAGRCDNNQDRVRVGAKDEVVLHD